MSVIDEKVVRNEITRGNIYNKIPNDHVRYLEKLKNDGFEPKVIYDIGSCVLNWTKEAKKLWPEAHYFLFEGNSDVDFLYKEKGINNYFLGVLSNRTGNIVKWYENKLLYGGNSYYRENNEKIFPEDRFLYRITHSLDDVVSNMNFPPPELVKIDVQGSEKDIVEGGINTLSLANLLIIEIQDVEYNIGAPNAIETIPYIEKTLNVQCIAHKLCNNGQDADYGFTKVT